MPRLTQAKAPLTCEVDAVNEFGQHISVSVPAERALTVYVDKRELVTLMTLGAHPELLVLGYLCNQRLIKDVTDIESITVDWDVGAAAVKTRSGIADIEEKTSRRVVTTGCGQGSVFGGLMDDVEQIQLPVRAAMSQTQLYALVNTIRLKETTYKSSGSVHACALFCLAAGEPDMLLFVEDVGRHNAIDTIAGWMAMNMASTLVASRTALPPEEALRLRTGEAGPAAPACKDMAPMRVDRDPEGLARHTTGRLTSELVALRTALPPEEALRLRTGEAGPAAPACKDMAPMRVDRDPEDLALHTTGRLTSELVASRTALPPEEALRLRTGEAGPAAPAGKDMAPMLVDRDPEGLVFYTTGRLTSEMVIKSAQMGVPIVVSRSGITQMGHQVAQRVGLCAIGRATNKRFLCYTHAQRLLLEPGLAG